MAESATTTRKRTTTRKSSSNGSGNGKTPTPSPTFPITELNAAVEQLQRPFTQAAVKIKPQATAERNGGMVGLVTFYVDSRLVVERLNAVVGPAAWSDEYTLLCEGRDAPALGVPVECSLTVLGVKRTDVGQISPGNIDDKAWKSAYSDALKRAAVKFRIGAYLYGTPNVWAEVKVGRNGKAQGFTPAGRKVAMDAYSKWLRDVVSKAYGDPLDHGDPEHVEAIGDVPENGAPAQEKTEPTPSPTPAPKAAEVPHDGDDTYCGKVEDAAFVARLLAATEQIGAKDTALGALAKHRGGNDGRLKRAWITGQVERAEEAAALVNGTAQPKPEPCAECGALNDDHKEGCPNDIPF